MAEVKFMRKLKTTQPESPRTNVQPAPSGVPIRPETGPTVLNKVCPFCGMEMEKGYLGMEEIFSDISWFKEKTTFGTGGVSLNIKDKLGIAYVDAFRCRHCRVIEAKY